jgi:hypothetical protein
LHSEVLKLHKIKILPVAQLHLNVTPEKINFKKSENLYIISIPSLDEHEPPLLHGLTG